MICAQIDFLNIGGLDVVLPNQSEHFTHGWMRQRAGWMRLDRHSGRSECPWLAKSSYDGAGIEASTRGLKKSKWRFQNIFGGGPSVQGQVRGYGSIFRGVARVKGLGHRTEIIPEAPALCGGD